LPRHPFDRKFFAKHQAFRCSFLLSPHWGETPCQHPFPFAKVNPGQGVETTAQAPCQGSLQRHAHHPCTRESTPRSSPNGPSAPVERSI
jgi:hypothetical protein